jgi:hypothetical protein
MRKLALLALLPACTTVDHVRYGEIRAHLAELRRDGSARVVTTSGATVDLFASDLPTDDDGALAAIPEQTIRVKGPPRVDGEIVVGVLGAATITGGVFCGAVCPSPANTVSVVALVTLVGAAVVTLVIARPQWPVGH